ncbi:MAG TPA: hypothetical protein VG819_11530 [Rhizomicrobium sp.]|jgi:hypothetical protein|nr:hypothetical protein [Rhizomicrobium sp.]
MLKSSAAPVALLALVLPAAAQACACGCAIFDVATTSLLPGGPGGALFLEYDFLNQTTNWSGGHAAPAAANDDKKIRSDFMVFGGQYMTDSGWGVMAEIPVTHRGFLTADSGTPEQFDHTALGDVRLMASYSGFSPDMSTGIVVGVKLPTGDSTYADFDPDVEIGSGSTDILLGAYHTGDITPDGRWGYYGQFMWQHEVATRNRYTPGSELNGALGVSYQGWTIGTMQISPVFQIIASYRGRDGGLAGDPDETGYARLLVAPGVKADFGAWAVYADVEAPVLQSVNGNQLIAPAALKLIASARI